MLLCQDKQGNKHRIYFDMTRSQSGAFINEQEILNTQEFKAPFDNKLARCATYADRKSVV